MSGGGESSDAPAPADGQPRAADADTLPRALARHGISLPEAQIELVDRYCRLLWDWNEKLNLTRHTDYEKFVSRDLVDTLHLAAVLGPGEQVLDVGTGGGVPGVVLAILRPDLEVALCESVAKKARAVEHIVAQLALPVPVHHARAEELLGDLRFDSLVARAVAPLEKLLGWLKPAWLSFSRLLVIKGPAWVEERRAARARGHFHTLQLRKLAAWPLPLTHSESVLLEIRPK